MGFPKEMKTETIQKYQKHKSDTGSPEVQIALLTQRINDISQHLAKSQKDFHARRGLMRMVGQRRRLLDYLHDTDVESYRQLIEKLDLRK